MLATIRAFRHRAARRALALSRCAPRTRDHRRAGLPGRMLRRLGVVGLTAASVLGFAAPVAAQACGDRVQYRVWQPNREAWYDHGETIQVVTGRDVDLYLHVDLDRPNPHGTRADIGYPQEFNFQGLRSRDVLRHVRMKSQSADDRGQGRIRFRAEEPGTTRLGYVIEGIQGARLDRLPGACRRDQLTIEVVSSPAEIDDRGRDDPGGQPVREPDPPPRSEREDAAIELVGRLMEAFLQRDVDSVESDWTTLVISQGRRGIETVAEEILLSSEFQRSALDRVADDYGRRARTGELQFRLLEAIHRDLYDDRGPGRGSFDDDYDRLVDCMDGRRGAGAACRDLAVRLLDRRAFYDAHRDVIDEIRREDSWRRR